MIENFLRIVVFRKSNTEKFPIKNQSNIEFDRFENRPPGGYPEIFARGAKILIFQNTKIFTKHEYVHKQYAGKQKITASREKHFTLYQQSRN